MTDCLDVIHYLDVRDYLDVMDYLDVIDFFHCEFDVDFVSRLESLQTWSAVWWVRVVPRYWIDDERDHVGYYFWSGGASPSCEAFCRVCP